MFQLSVAVLVLGVMCEEVEERKRRKEEMFVSIELLD